MSTVADRHGPRIIAGIDSIGSGRDRLDIKTGHRPPPGLAIYYAATVPFALLDFGAGLSLRYAFLDPWPVARGLAYLAGASCLALVLRWPARAGAVAATESGLTLAGLILAMGVRVLGVDPEPVGGAPAPVTGAGLANFLLAGGACWLALRPPPAGGAESRR